MDAPAPALAVPSAQAPPTAQEEPWLAYVPVALFAVVMGTGGLGLSWRVAHRVLGVPELVSHVALGFAGVAFAAILALYGAKALRHGEAMAAEFRHPVQVNFFAAISVALIVLSAAATPVLPALARALWIAGALLHLGLALVIIRRWLTHSQDEKQASPAWFIPIVGNILVPVAGVPLGFVDLSWFFFAVGFFLWLPFLAIMLHRLIFMPELSGKACPTVAILVAPPAVGFLASHALLGGLNPLSQLLFYLGLFMALVLVSLEDVIRRLDFTLSWWAFTFPAAALATAALVFHSDVGSTATLAIAVTLLMAATAIVLTVFTYTVQALVRRRLFVPE